MAGSRSHVTADDGSFTFNLIDNLGDAYEACKELFDLVNRYEAALNDLADDDHVETWTPLDYRDRARSALGGG